MEGEGERESACYWTRVFHLLRYLDLTARAVRKLDTLVLKHPERHLFSRLASITTTTPTTATAVGGGGGGGGGGGRLQQ